MADGVLKKAAAIEPRRKHEDECMANSGSGRNLYLRRLAVRSGWPAGAVVRPESQCQSRLHANERASRGSFCAPDR